jgi:Cap4 SAVED domain
MTVKTKPKQSPSPAPPKKPGGATPPPPQHVLKRWFAANSSTVGKHPLHLMTEHAGLRAAILDDLRILVRAHYMSPDVAARRLADLGAPATAKILRELLPKTKAARSGDIGEVFATEIAEQILSFVIPVRRLRWKDGRNMALRGDDVIGVRIDARGKLVAMLKGESKSYITLTNVVLDKAAEALDRDRGRPGRHAVLFIATRLRETGKPDDEALAAQLEAAVVASFSGCDVEQFLFVLTGNNPENLLTSHLTAVSRKKRTRHAVGARIADHGEFIKLLFGGL